MHLIDTQKIQNFRVVGINYKKTDAALRGMYAVNNEQYEYLLSIAKDHDLNELFIISTCNRTEIYGFADNSGQLAELLCTVTAGEFDTFMSMAYEKSGEKAIEHLFRVAAGLDSQILGDYEILGQIKTAVKYAKSQGFIGNFTERLINSVLQSSKAIKTHTALSGGTVSTAFAAVQYIREYFEGPADTPAMKCPASHHLMTGEGEVHNTNHASIEEKKIVVLGTGKIGRSACRNLVDYLGTTNVTLINRTEETAATLAKELGLKCAPIATLENELADADIIIVSTNATEPVVLQRHLTGKGEKLVIDLSVPCNVEAAAQQLPGIKFVDVDVLSRIKDETLSRREAEVPRAMTIIKEIMDEFMQWYEMRKNVPVLKEVRNKLRKIGIEATHIEGSALHADKEERIQKVINSLAANIRRKNTLGCHYIQAINEYIA